MEIRIRDTGQVASEREFRSLHPRTSFPPILTTAILDDFGANPVLEAPAPAVTQYQSAVRNGVVQDSLGNWVYAWSVRDWSAEEIAAAQAALVPQEAEMADARTILLRHGYTDAAVRQAIAGSTMTEQQKAEALIAWEFRAKVRRNSVLLETLRALLGITPALADQMFIEARDLQ